MPLTSPARVLAFGATLKNRACLIDGDQVSWSPVHGDLDTVTSRLALEQSGGQIYPQGWEFYATTGALFLTLAFPGFVYRYLFHRRG